MRSGFSKQAIPMVWDYAEGNPFESSSAGFLDCVAVVAKCLHFVPAAGEGAAKQIDATQSVNGVKHPVICTDPPYYSNIGYADLSDFFYVWLRRSLQTVYPALFGTMLVPKEPELIASPYRHEGDTDKAKNFFEQGLEKAFRNSCSATHPDIPMTVFYAFKQSETDEEDEDEEETGGVASTGWETMLNALLNAGLMIVGTWPMRTEGDNRQVGIGTNALASSIVLVCRPRSVDAKLATRRDFLTTLKKELPEALKKLQRGNIAPVDLAQAAIGPGMAVFSRFKHVLESGGKPMTIRTALQLINQALDEVLSEQDSEYDAHTRFALAWFEQYALNEGPFGDADVLARAKDCSPDGLVSAGVLSKRAGKVRLLKRDELPANWPPPGRQPYVWEATQHLIRALETDGEAGAAAVLRGVSGLGEIARDLAYRLYSTCEKKKWAEEARAYNGLVIAWPEVLRLSRQQPSLPKGKAKPSLFEDTDDE